MDTKFSEKYLRLLLDVYRNTPQGEWITPLNPDNITIHFYKFRKRKSDSTRNSICLNKTYSLKELFPCYVRELWYIKERRACYWRYWLSKLFRLKNFVDKADVAMLNANHWLYGGYNGN